MDVFISHSHRDKPIVREIAKRLRQEGIQPWLDEEFIQPGQSWTEGIHRAISNSDALIVVVSRATTESKWQTSEIALSIAQQRANPSKRVIPVVIDKDAELPFFLRDYRYCDLSDDEHLQRNFPQLLRALITPPESRVLPLEIDRARLNELKLQRDFLIAETKMFERKRVVWTTTVLAGLFSVIGASAALLAYFLSDTMLELGFVKVADPFAMGILFGVVSSLLASFAYHRLQRRSAQKEVDHDEH